MRTLLGMTGTQVYVSVVLGVSHVVLVWAIQVLIVMIMVVVPFWIAGCPILGFTLVCTLFSPPYVAAPPPTYWEYGSQSLTDWNLWYIHILEP